MKNMLSISWIYPTQRRPLYKAHGAGEHETQCAPPVKFQLIWRKEDVGDVDVLCAAQTRFPHWGTDCRYAIDQDGLCYR